MPRCPNCRRRTARTEDWACPWCGYPLLSGDYKKIPKTYKQLKEERRDKQELPVTEETETPPLPKTLGSELEPEPEVKPEPEPETKPEPEPEEKPKKRAKKTKAAEAKATVEAAPVEPKPEPETEPEPEPESEPDPNAIEMTMEELNSVYTANHISADMQFKDKLLRVTGAVDRILTKEDPDMRYIILTGAKEDAIWNVRCGFDKKHSGKLNTLKTGQQLSVQGTYTGYSADIKTNDSYKLNIILQDCRLVG